LNNGDKIAVGSNGNRHLIFQHKFEDRKDQGCEIRYAYAHRDSSYTWHLESMYGSTYYPSIALSPLDTPYVVYVGWGNPSQQTPWVGEYVTVLHKNPQGNWQAESNPGLDLWPNQPNHFFYPSIVFAPDTQWYTTWVVRDGTGTKLKCTSRKRNNDLISPWQVDVSSYQDGIQYPSIARDADGCVNILYQYRPQGSQLTTIKHARLENGVWHYYVPTYFNSQNHPSIDMCDRTWGTTWGVWEDNLGYNDVAFSYFMRPWWVGAASHNHIFESAAPSVYPVVDEGYALWVEEESRARVYYSNFWFETQGWSPPDLISPSHLDSRYPQTAYEEVLYLYNDWLHMVWTQKKLGTQNPQYEVIYKMRSIIPELPVIDCDLGKSEDSPYTQYRDGWTAYGALPCLDIDYGYSNLIYLIPGLDSTKTYWLEMAYYHEDSDAVVQSLVVDGETLDVSTLAPYYPEYVMVELPAGAVADGEAGITIAKESGEFGVAGVMKLFTEGGGARGSGSRGGAQVAALGGHSPGLAFLLTINPNPVGDRATITLELPQAAEIEVSIYDLRGALVRSVADEILGEGTHMFVWDGRDGSGVPARSGVYICRATCGEQVRAAKMVVAR
jgi:hypothetical protein